MCYFEVQQAFVQAELKEVVVMRMPKAVELDLVR